MLSFENDYNTGAHPKILERLIETNLEPLSGYGNDIFCETAKAKIKAAIDCEQAEIYFLTGGTQTNALVISSMLNDCEGVISADTGHISVHEAGAIEYTGHKVITLKNHSGKIKAKELENHLNTFHSDENRQHMVFPAMVYISQPTEYGTLYSKAELTEISNICQKYTIPLFIDGARLSYALNSPQNDISLPELAKLCDVFYIGGTKTGALCGEAVVFTKADSPKYFYTKIKQHGALMAKGRLLGIQFDTLFTDNLYMNIGKHVIEMAEELKKVLKSSGCQFYLETPTNQQFIIIENSKIQELSEKVVFSFWEKADEEHTIIRFVTGWSTTPEDISKLKTILQDIY